VSTVLHDVVRVERDGAIAVVTIDHPPANAISRAVLRRGASNASQRALQQIRMSVTSTKPRCRNSPKSLRSK